MIPSVVGRQARETVLDYLRTTFRLADADFERSLFEFLEGDRGLFRGPYVDVRLPFRRTVEGAQSPLDIQPGFRPYRHQQKAFERLYSKAGHQPQHTLVTTGTGSGKTECFLYPILDHCWQTRDDHGIKAIILYPMNALASDQARRLARMLWDDDRLKGKVSAGLYVGGEGQHGTADRDHLVDRREILRDSPPDILLTNYKMLDFLLLRPEDSKLWRHNGPSTLRYLVLDELHTYDGAQGSDVACLIRRLNSRLECTPGSLCCVGTSATLGGGVRDETVAALTGFATKVFGERFFGDTVITEERCDVRETLGSVVDDDHMPLAAVDADLDPDAFDSADEWIGRQAEIWFGAGADADPLAVGKRLERHDFLRQVLRLLAENPLTLDELSSGLRPRVPGWEELPPDRAFRLLESFLGLVSQARREGEHGQEPFLTVQVQLWVRELRRLVRDVSGPGAPVRFGWVDEGPAGGVEDADEWFPIAHCRDCGSAGLAAYQREGEGLLRGDQENTGWAWFLRGRNCRYVTFGEGVPEDGFPEYLCPGCFRLQLGPECDRCRTQDENGAAIGPVQSLPVRVSRDVSGEKPPRFLARCPDCGADGALSMLGSRAPSLLSVAISLLYLTDYNRDKKLLAFTDSVQDASHRAGFFGARTYRFNIRTAFQSAVDSAAQPASLAELGDRTWERWASAMEWERLVPTLLPPDLRELSEYQAFLAEEGRKHSPKLESDLRKRLGWEATLEYGLNNRVGRTLESTLCSSIAVDEPSLAKATEIVGLELEDGLGLLSAPASGFDPEDVRHFLEGILHRLRGRGGIDHPLLHGYVRSGGNWYLLTKRKNPLMSPFGRRSVFPRFAMDKQLAPGSDAIFDCFRSAASQRTWYRDWAARSLGLSIDDPGINELYGAAFSRLEDAGLLVSHPVKKDKATAWGLDPARLLVTSEAAHLACPVCRRRYTLARPDAERWAGRRCPQYRCDGELELSDERDQSYYARIYRSDRLERIVAHEHTGLLSRHERERIEEQFKEGRLPGAPNLFVATPTLEMGIDVGDLSAAVLCSVAPSPSNYLQRVGRAGRKTGNAFCLTLANSRPHDLYFFDDPREMIAGQVLPPGCFLNAPEMLRRQLVAHAMDAWARDETEVSRIPSQTGFILGKAGETGFPGRFIKYFGEHQAKLTASFLSMFEGELSEENRQRLEEFAGGQNVPDLVREAFDRVRREIDDLRAHGERAKRRIKEIEAKPESVEDPQLEKEELEEARRVLGRLALELRHKYPLNLLCDEGVLPNYAFPEPGVRLESVVSEPTQGGGVRYEAREYLRPASTAIRELAPFNTFYADGRKVKVDEVDVGTKAKPLLEGWRLCPDCNHATFEATGGVASGDEKEGEPDVECPRCGSLGWPDAGQSRKMLHFRRSRSLANRLAATTSDDTEDREEEFYDLLNLIDVAPNHYSGARLIEELPFGYELLKKLQLREINFGLQHGTGGLSVCGEKVSAEGFQVCVDCGRVRNGDGSIRHTPTCKARKDPTKESAERIYLYRELESEAIRILLPVSEMRLDEKRASLQAALQLGFRRHFQGDPVHLLLKSVREPVQGAEGARQYLVIFDAVPGGTGYLSELWQGNNLFEILELALKALQSCDCQRVGGRDGCYRCLYAYQNQRDLPKISSRLAQEMLQEILSRAAELKDFDTLSHVPLDQRLESELEEKFLFALEERAEAEHGVAWEEKIVAGEKRWVLRFEEAGGAPGPGWEIRAQVNLGSAQHVSPSSRPDFLISPLSGDPAIRPVAIFCDGFAYHGCPDKASGRIGDDVEKRQGILDSGRYQVWSMGWKDVTAFEEGKAGTWAGSLFSSLSPGHVGQIGLPLGLSQNGLQPGSSGSMEMLWAYLKSPSLDRWCNLAAAWSVAWLTSEPGGLEAPEDGTVLEEKLLEEPERFAIMAAGAGSPSDSVLTRVQARPWFAALARCSAAALSEGEGGLSKLRFVLRLFDEHAGRAAPEFEADWRAFLQAWNLLQFLEHVTVVSSEALETGYGPLSTGYGATATGESQPAPYDASTGAPDGALQELLEISTDAARPLIEAAHQAGLGLPELDFEIEGAAAEVVADVAWPVRRVAVLAELQRGARPAFEEAGWTVLEHPVDPDLFVETLSAQPEVSD